MTTPRLRSTEAVVLRLSDLGEADRIVTLYTPGAGKIRAVAKGSRRPMSRLGGHVELFVHSTVLIAKGTNLDIITQAETINPFMGLRDNLERATLACYAAEILDKLVGEHDAEPEVFDLFLTTLARLADDRRPEQALRVFAVQLFDHLGYRPQLHNCVRCQKLLEPSGNFFSASAGGVFCLDCGGDQPDARGISTNAFKLLRLFQAGDYAFAARVRVDDTLGTELERILRGYAEHITEREMKSAAMIDTLRESRPRSIEPLA